MLNIKRTLSPLFITIVTFCITSSLAAPQIQVNLGKLVHEVSPTLFGIFFEEINHAGEGGLYGELIQNRAFDALSGDPGVSAPSKLVSIEAYSLPNFYLRHCDYLGYFTEILSDLDEHDSTFTLTPGLANSSYVSLESINYPGYYLRHFNYRLELAQDDNSQQFKEDASFFLSKALDGSSGVSFEAYNYPNYYLMFNSSNTGGCTQVAEKYNVYLAPFENSQSYKTNTTFLIQSPNINAIYPWASIQEGNALINISADDSFPLNSVSRLAAKLVASQYSGSNYAGFFNPGYYGILAHPDTYQLSFWSLAEQDFISHGGDIIFSIESQDGSTVYAKVVSAPLKSTWTKQQLTLQVPQGVMDSNARFAVRLSAEGTVYLDVVSLFPSTFNNRPNGLRKDLANSLAAMNAKFVRFPGGCYVEGHDVATAFLWKNSTGPIEERPGHYSFWGYWSTDGLGFLEYLTMIEDLNAIPIWVIHIGIFTGDTAIPFADIEPWIQDALDSIEYANGDTSTTWGAKRAADGHPTPFNIQIIALGNENGCNFDTNHIYVKYYEAFATRIRALYPHIQLIANCDISSQTSLIDLFDVHLYNSPQWFVQNANMFDNFNRSGPKAFVSEYAVTSDCGNGNLIAGIAEAAFMIGLVRNSDVVALASYAPLFVNVNTRQWNPDAIQFNSSVVAPTPSYYVQQLFMKFTGKQVVLTTFSGLPAGVSAIATFDNSTGNVYLPIVNFSPNATQIDIQISGAMKIQNVGEVYVLTNSNPNAENTLDAPTTVSPRTLSLQISSPSFSYLSPPYSLSILILTVAV